jgi:hypothetical protein
MSQAPAVPLVPKSLHLVKGPTVAPGSAPLLTECEVEPDGNCVAIDFGHAFDIIKNPIAFRHTVEGVTTDDVVSATVFVHGKRFELTLRSNDVDAWQAAAIWWYELVEKCLGLTESERAEMMESLDGLINATVRGGDPMDTDHAEVN